MYSFTRFSKEFKNQPIRKHVTKLFAKYINWINVQSNWCKETIKKFLDEFRSSNTRIFPRDGTSLELRNTFYERRWKHLRMKAGWMRFSVPSNRVYSRLKATPLVDAVIQTWTTTGMMTGMGGEWKETEENCETEGTRDVNLKRFVKPWYRYRLRSSVGELFVKQFDYFRNSPLREIYLGKKIGLTVFRHPCWNDYNRFYRFYLSNLSIRVLNNSSINRKLCYSNCVIIISYRYFLSQQRI